MAKQLVPDGGWGWMVTVGCAIINLLFGFVVRGFGILYLMLRYKFNGSAFGTTWVGTSLLISWGLTGPVSGFLLQRYSCRTVALTGSLLSSLGMIMTGFAPSLKVAYFTYGITGCGLALAFNAAYLCVGTYFSSKKSVAIGIGTMGSAVGALICPPTLEYFFDSFGYCGGMIMFSCVTLQGCVAASMFYPLKKDDSVPVKLERICEEKGFESSADVKRKRKTGQRVQRCHSYLRMLYDPLLISLLLMSFSIFSMYFIFSMVPALAVQNGIPARKGSLLVTANAVFDAVAKIIVAPLFDAKHIRKHRPIIYAVLGILSGSKIVFLPLCKTFHSLIVMSSLFGLMDGGVGGQRLTIISDIMGPAKLPDSLGLSVLFASLGSVLTSLYLGVIIDCTGRLDVGFYTVGGISVVSFFVLLIGILRNKSRIKGTKNITITEEIT